MTESISAKKESLLIKAQYYSLLLLILFLPLSKKITPPLILIWTVCYLLSGDIKNKISSILKSTIGVLMIIFYLLHLAGMIYTSNMQTGWFDLEVKFSILLLPLLVFGMQELISKYLDKALLCFVIGNFVVLLICFSYASYRVIFEQYFRFAIYTEFSLFLHPSYAAMYALFSICVIVYFFLSKKLDISCGRISSRILKLSAWFMLLFFLSGIYFYSSRAGLIALAVIAVVTVIFVSRSLNSKRVKILLPLVCVVIIAGIFKYNSRFQELISFFQSKESISYQTKSNAEIRYIMIAETFGLIKENILIGVGTGDTKSVLMDRYKKKHFDAGVEENLNVHNQFLESQLGLGIFGGLLLLIIVSVPLVSGIRNKNFLHIAFALIIIVNFMFESMLNVQAGVVFCSLFYSMLACSKAGTENYA